MPGEELDAALDAAAELQGLGIATVLTYLGENVADEAAVAEVVERYVDAVDRISERGLDVELSVKPTQLGLDLPGELCSRSLDRLAEQTSPTAGSLWIDMEASPYVERTLELYRELQAERGGAGLCLQAYLHRTPKDLDDLFPLSPAIRLVKGAYQEPSGVALTRRTDVDARFLELGTRLLERRTEDPDLRVAFATHDGALIESLRAEARRLGVPPGAYEFQLLYGIRPEEQRRLAREGESVRVLISYGDAWYPWYMRRLAERPANLLFVFRNMLPGSSR